MIKFVSGHLTQTTSQFLKTLLIQVSKVKNIFASLWTQIIFKGLNLKEREEWVQRRLIKIFEGKLHYRAVKQNSKKEKEDDLTTVILFEELKKFLKDQKVSEESWKQVKWKLTQQLSTKEESSFLTFYSWLRKGMQIDSSEEPIFLINWKNPKKNFFAIQKEKTIFAHTNKKSRRRADVLIYINGLPLAIWELKRPKNQQSLINEAIKQLEEYYSKIPKLFLYCHFLLVSNYRETYLFANNKFNRPQAGAKKFHIYQIRLDFYDFIKSFFEKNNFLERLRDYFYISNDGVAEIIPVEKRSIKKISSINSFLNSHRSNLKILNLNFPKFFSRIFSISVINKIVNSTDKNWKVLVLISDRVGYWEGLEYAWQTEIQGLAKSYLGEEVIEWDGKVFSKSPKSKFLLVNIRKVAKFPEILASLMENFLIICDYKQFNHFFMTEFNEERKRSLLFYKSIEKYFHNLNFKGKVLLLRHHLEKDWSWFFKWKCRFLKSIEYIPTGRFTN